jgi:hypothetical protein
MPKHVDPKGQEILSKALATSPLSNRYEILHTWSALADSFRRTKFFVNASTTDERTLVVVHEISHLGGEATF